MARRVSAVAATVLASVVAATQVRAQDHTTYLQLLDAYARNDKGAAATLARWPENRVKEAVRTLDQVAALYCARDDPRRARLEINQGLAVDRKQRYLNLVAGALIEFEIAQEEPNLRGRWNVPLEREDFLRKQLHQAAQIYRVVLSGHPDFLEARLRLGWVLTLNDSLQAAREQLEIVAARTTNTDVSYLAHMFLAALHERADHPAEAAREYEAARQVAPYQSSLVALIRATAASGEVDRARALAEAISVMVDSGQADPWLSYKSCFTGDELFTGLRAEARAP